MKNFEQVCRLVRQGLDDGAYPSACLSVGIRGSVCVRQTFGPARETTLYDIASLSKIVGTTMIAFRFLEEGRLRLYDTVEQFFPAPEDKKGITVLQLMTHTSGLPAHFYLSEEADGPGDAVRAILAHPLEHAPGALPVYSCMGYILLGRILEQIGGQSIDRLAQEYVFEPLGLTHTTYRPAGDVAPTERDPATGELLRGAVHDENARFLGGLSGNAGIFSDLCDMTRFVQMLALGGKLPDGTQFLSPATLRAALVNRTPGAGHEFRGLGFNLAGSPSNFGRSDEPARLRTYRLYRHQHRRGPRYRAFCGAADQPRMPHPGKRKAHPHAFADPQRRGRRGRTHAAGGAAMELICRAAAQADLPACCNVFADSEIYERYFSAPGALARSLENALNAGELYVACGSAGEVLGVMRVRAKGFCGLYPYLALIGAAPRARGRGVGHFLLAEFEAMARVQGAGRVALMVSDFNEKAQALYRSLGYWELGRLPDAVRKGVSELVLIKDL